MRSFARIFSSRFFFRPSKQQTVFKKFFAVSVCGVFGSISYVSCREKKWPVLTKAEIEKHSCEEAGVWMVVGNGVYDVTEFLEQHPGGKEKILEAAGKRVDPFWNIYRRHYTEQVQIILKDWKIGEIDPKEWPVAALDDPYVTDPPRDPSFTFHSLTPCNAETPADRIASSFLTPNHLFFVRNHSPVPLLHEETYRLTVKGADGTESKSLTLDQLKNDFKKVDVVASLQCAGNRRKGLNDVIGRPPCLGTEWNVGAMSTAKWSGVPLREVLAACGFSRSYTENQLVQHVIFEGADGVIASVPIQKAITEGDDVLLAYEMNDMALPRDHGYPLRVIVPGHVGIRNVKWVEKIECSAEEAKGPWQRGMAYKGLNPFTTSTAGIDVEKLSSLQEMPVQSAIVSPQEGADVPTKNGKFSVRGYAWSGGGRGIMRVDVSADMGKTWHVANLKEGREQAPDKAWAWTLWEAEVPLPQSVCSGSRIELRCRATDASFNVQPESRERIWNLRGIANNAEHKVTVKPVQEKE